jgi:hypothetical protein
VLNFPDTPAANQVFTSGPSWAWDGVKWKTNPSGLPDQSVNLIAPAEGALVTLNDFRPVFADIGPLNALTFKLPPNPTTSSVVEINFLHSVSSIAVQDSTGATLSTSPTSAYGPGSALIFRYTSAGWVYWK